MANPSNRTPSNAPGKFYVDDSCIDCDLCRETAPENFARNEDDNYSYVAVQPRDDAEEELCLSAAESCPTEAIGNDGA